MVDHQGRPGSVGVIRFKTSFTNTIHEAMKKRGWRETNSNTNWDLIWVERDIAYDTFDTKHLLNWQKVNHFRNDKELCRKDLLVKNLKKKRRAIEKEGRQDEAEKHGFWPTTYVLPGEYALFAEESKRRPSAKWIMKPINRSQGRGIFIVTKLSQVCKWKSDNRWEKPKEDGPETYVVQRYITNPYLVAGRKFDMRLYVLVTSFTPLTVWVYRSGFCRFSHARYSNAMEDLVDMEKHLTNVAIQKRTESYDKDFGGKWGIRELKLHLMGIHGVRTVNTLFHDIQSLILRSLLSVQQVMINDKHCFALYGYDVLFDDKLKPWLLEVNASPSLSANTAKDKELKVAMLTSVLDVLDLEGRNRGDEIRIGGFDLIHAGGPIPHIGTFSANVNSLYTTAIGAEIPEHRVDYMPKNPDGVLPSSGASSGHGTDKAPVRNLSAGASAAAASGEEAREGRGSFSSCSFPPKTSSGREGVGGCGGNSVAGSSRSSSSSSSFVSRGARTVLHDSLSRDSRDAGRGESLDVRARCSTRSGGRRSKGVGGHNKNGVGAKTIKNKRGSKPP